MRIVHIVVGLVGGGRERRLIQLIKGLSCKPNVTQDLILLLPKIDYDEIYQMDVQLHILGKTSHIARIRDLKKILKIAKPDIIHLWTEDSTTLLATSILKHFLHAKLIVGFLADGNIIKDYKTRLINYLSYLNADAIVSNSRAGLIAKRAIMSKSHVIYNGFDYNRLTNISLEDIREFRIENQISEPYIISMLARFNKAKDYPSFLNLAKHMSRIRKDVHFVAVGKGETLEKMQILSKNMQLTNVSFLGFRKDIDTILAASYVTILFSNNEVHSEGISNSIMESMAIGKPVIASDGGGTPEIIENGHNGYIVAPHDSKTAAMLLDKLLSDSDLYGQLSIHAVETIGANFLLDEMADKYFNLYKSLL